MTERRLDLSRKPIQNEQKESTLDELSENSDPQEQISLHVRKMSELISKITKTSLGETIHTNEDLYYLTDNGIYVDWVKLKTDAEYRKEVCQMLMDYIAELELVSETLIERLDLINDGMKIMRSSKDGKPIPWLEPGWRVYKVYATGKVRVKHPQEDTPLFKTVNRDEIEAWNPLSSEE